MPLDPVIRALFESMPGLADAQMWRLSPRDARAALKAMSHFADSEQVPIGKIETVQAESEAGPIPLRIYTPVAAGGAALPALVYFHGGGFVIGDLDIYDPLCRKLANDSGCRIVAVEYRLAPEHPFPAAVEDSFAALKWIEAHAPDLGIDPNRIAVGGDSAGGNLAAVMALLAKAAKGPRIAFQMLIYPITDFSQKGGSLEEFARGYFLDMPTMNWFRDHYVGKGQDHSDLRLSPIQAKDVSHLPPAYIVTAGFDPLRDQGRAYAEKLKAAGVPVTHIDYPTMIHGFFSMQDAVPLAGEAIAAAALALKTALAEA